MYRAIFQIFWFSFLLVLISIIHFFSLIIELPVYISVTMMIICGIVSFKVFSRRLSILQPLKYPHNIIFYIILLIGVFLVTNRVYYLEETYGAWDAWWFWNYHAKYLADIANWKTSYLTQQVPHADYPLFLPSLVAFWWHLLHSFTPLVPYLIGFVFTLFIPVVIFLDLQTRNIFIAAISMFLLATDDEFLKNGVDQIADIPLAFFFLASLISIRHYRNSFNNIYLVFAGFMIGACTWTKNEGILLAFMFFIFNADTLLKQKGKQFVQGLAIPLTTLVIFKLFYAPPNDIIAGQSGKTLSNLTDPYHYTQIWFYFKLFVNKYFQSSKWALIIYAVVCLLQRRFPDRDMLMLLCILVCYLAVYLFSPHNIDWHLQTSLNRIMLHLMPALLYVVGVRLSEN